MGYGRVGGHRKHPGGRGKCGGEHHRRMNFTMYHPGHFGKLGMRYFHKRRNIVDLPTINVDCLWTLVPEERRDALLERKSSTEAPVIDVTRLGYHKVLGRGILPNCPLIVKARIFSEGAEEKIRAAGGVPVLVP